MDASKQEGSGKVIEPNTALFTGESISLASIIATFGNAVILDTEENRQAMSDAWLKIQKAKDCGALNFINK